MIKIRNDCFETNSSSVHAMIISKEEISPVNVTVHFDIGEYGWEEREYHDIDDKASYFYTAACAVKGYDVEDEITNMLSPYGIKCKFGIAKFKSYKSSYDNKTYTYLNNGYVDHDYDCADFVNAMMNDPDMLVRFLFNNDSFVHTGNDNDEMEWFDEVRNTDYPHDLFVKGN